MSNELNAHARPQYLLYSPGFGHYCTRDGSGPLCDAIAFTESQQANADAHKERFAPDAQWLKAADLSKLGAVVAYVAADGTPRRSSWVGDTKQVWAQFPAGQLPALADMREAMQAAYEPLDGPVPAGLTVCTCFVSAEPLEQPVPQGDDAVCLSCPQFKQHSTLRARFPRNCLNWLLVGGTRCPNKALIELQVCQASKYIVIDEHTLCYWIPEWQNAVGILAGSVRRGGHNPLQGWTHIVPGHTKVRVATKEDFAEYRVMLPPDFNQ